jgi:lipoprotein-releasing system permease protein
MSFELEIAFKYLKKRRHGFFAFVTTLVAIGGVMIGVGALIIVLSVMNGFRSDIQEKTLGIQPHLVVYGTEKTDPLDISGLEDKLKRNRAIKETAPFIIGQMLLKSPNSTLGVVVRGIQVEKEKKVSSIGKMLVAGSWDKLRPATEPNEAKAAFLGKELAQGLGVSLGQEIVAYMPTETAALGGVGMVPRIEKLRVEGIFHAGFYEYDSGLVLVNYEDAQKLFNLTGATGIGLRTDSLDEASEIAAQVSIDVGPAYWARSWQELNRNLFKALKLEKLMMSIILALIILVAAFTIISNLILLSIEKTRDIGILRALGASSAMIRKIFLYAGMTLGSIGVICGIAIGLLGIALVSQTNLFQLPQDIYYIDHLPVKLSLWDILWVAIGAFGITAVSAIYPAHKASEVNPVEAIRYG